MSTARVRVRLDTAKFSAAIKKGSRRGMYAAMDHLGTISKEQVPLRDGPLRDSGNASVSADGKTGCYSYDTPYAIPQHEHTEFQHQRGRKAKYLEDPVNDKAVQNEMLELLAKECRKEF